MPPLLSIVIVNYNYGRFLDDAILSVRNQTCQDYELIIVDGGSTDNSVEVIKRYEERLAWWCSEKDGGQSDAFNKGFARAKGRFLTWLNADDVLFPHVVQNLGRVCDQNPASEWFAGGCVWLNPELKVIKCSNARPFSSLRTKYGGIPVWAPSSFFSKALLDRVGGVDTDFHYSMDTELWLRFYHMGKARYKPLNGYCWGWRLHPDAKTSGHRFIGSEHANKDHPIWKQRRRERELYVERYNIQKPPRWLPYVTANPLVLIKNKIDSWRYHGLPYKRILP